MVLKGVILGIGAVLAGGSLELNGNQFSLSNNASLLSSLTSIKNTLPSSSAWLCLNGGTISAPLSDVSKVSVLNVTAQTGTTTLSGDSTLSANADIMVKPGATLTVTGIVTPLGGSATTTVLSGGTLNINPTAALNISSGAITGSGTINVNPTASTTTQLGGTLTGFTGTLNTNVSNGTTQINSPLANNLAVTMNSNILTLQNSVANTLAITTNSSATTLNISGAGTSLSGTIVLRNSLNIGGNTSGYTISSNISGAGGLTFTAGNTKTLSGSNTYTGQTIVYSNNDILQVSSLNCISTGTYNGGVCATASSNLGTPTTVANGTIGLGNAAMAGQLVYTGTGETTDRVINLRASSGAATLTQSGSGLLKFTSNFTATGGGSKTLTLQGSTAGTGEISGAIIDNSGTNKTSVTKNGTGTWTLSGTNSYTGATTISGGVLSVTGSTNSGSAVAVNAGTLRGTGTVNGAVTVANASTAIIQGGTGSTGTLNLAGGLTFTASTTSQINVNTNGTNAVSLIHVTGTCAMANNKLNVLGTLNASTAYTVIQCSSTMSGTLPTLGTNSSGHTVTISQVGNNLVITTGV